MNLYSGLDYFMQGQYRRFYDLFIPLFVAPTIEESIVANGFDNVEDFMNYSFSFSFNSPVEKEEVRTYYYRDLIDSLDSFKDMDELEQFLVIEYESIRHRLLMGKLQWEMQHG